MPSLCIILGYLDHNGLRINLTIKQWCYSVISVNSDKGTHNAIYHRSNLDHHLPRYRRRNLCNAIHLMGDAMKYTVTIFECGDGGEEQARATWHYFDKLSLAQAWRIVERHARRGVKRFGGSVNRMNWGARGGSFPDNYRAATIKLDTF